MTFTSVLSKTLEAAKEFYDMHSVLKTKYGLDNGYTLSQVSQEYLNEFGIIKQQFQNYLLTLSSDEIEKIEVLMYCGRDGFELYGSLSKLRNELKTNKHTGYSAIHNVEGKIAALYLYLGRALEQADELGIDLDKSF